jgi:hypothetical protein
MVPAVADEEDGTNETDQHTQYHPGGTPHFSRVKRILRFPYLGVGQTSTVLDDFDSEPGPVRRTVRRYRARVDRMPQPGDRYAQAFTVEPGQCRAMIHDAKGQATHCSEPPTMTDRWLSPRGDGRRWRV